jgi:DNA-binding NarL/FixJ family response regulator
MSAKITVLIADDEALVRAGFRLLVEYAADLEVVGEAETGRRQSARPERSNPTSCSWTYGCESWTVSRRQG